MKSWYEKQVEQQLEDIDENSMEFMEAKAMIEGYLEFYMDQGIPEPLARRRVYSDIFLADQVIN